MAAASRIGGSEMRAADRRFRMMKADLHRNGQCGLAETILGSLTQRIAVVDRHGTIVATNAAWTDFGERHGITAPDVIGPGANYLDVCRRAVAAGCHEAASALEGIDAVCRGASDSFTTTYGCSVRADEGRCLMTATPLRRPGGGAVIVHTRVTDTEFVHMARGVSSGQLQRLLDNFPVPIWVAAPDGSLMYGNQRWRDARGNDALTLEHGKWTDLCHPEDRERAVASFLTVIDQGRDFEIELRLMGRDGAYRWSACRAAPQYGPDGALESYLGACWDTSAKRRMESAYQQLTRRLVATQEDERARIARELHDDIGQQVAVLTLKLQALDRAGRHSRPGLASARASLQEIATGLHTISHQLHPARLRLLGLVRTLDALCRDVSAESEIHIRFRASGGAPDGGRNTALCIFRVTQEALRNAVKHSGAAAIDVRLAATPSLITLRISDDGVGFDPLASPAAGLGLQTMRERVDLVGGTLSVEAARPHGTTIRVDIPTDRSTASDSAAVS